MEDHLQHPHPWRWVKISFSSAIILCLLFGIGLWYYRKHSNSAHQQLKLLSAKVRTQKVDLLRQQSLLDFEKSLSEIVDKYHTPHKRWKNYSALKRDIAPWLQKLIDQLDTLPLSEQEKIFCTISLIYSHMKDVEIADFMCYSKAGIRVFKNRILKK